MTFCRKPKKGVAMLSVMEFETHALPHEPPIRKGGETHGKTIMLIEESPMLRNVIVQELTSLGYRVLAAADPERPDFHTQLRLADIAVVSFHWNRGSGWEIFNRLKATHADLPVLLYTMADGPSTGVKAIVEALAEAFSPGQQRRLAS